MSDTSLSGVGGGPKPSRTQLNLAATIYGLCLLAQTDGSSDNSTMAIRVRARMAARAHEQLSRLGVYSGEVRDEHGAIRAAMRLKP